MKTWIPVLCAVALLAGCSGKKDPDVIDAPPAMFDRDQLEERRKGLFYFEGVPFKGVAVEKFSNGQKALGSHWGTLQQVSLS